ncbi:Ribonuclease inhibitor [Porphyridium purpureum]|uniref:Ribonuclease inhibitor n=1 Tax=Porphyridium purpureum TaxID=35688 RepID=A0A5J4YSR8_PORPP|nr:Ribonuclease inhibitor [Porphyridium purpureum]|eukprot:POR8518..scf227_4
MSAGALCAGILSAVPGKRKSPRRTFSYQTVRSLLGEKMNAFGFPSLGTGAASLSCASQRRTDPGVRVAAAQFRCSVSPDVEREWAHKQTLYLGGQRLGDSAMEHVARALQSSACRLQALNLDGNEIGDAGARILASGLEKNSTLEELIICDNLIGDVGMAYLATALARNAQCQVRVISLIRNALGAGSGEALRKLLASNRSVTTLYLMHQTIKGTGLQDAGARAFAQGMQENERIGGAFWFANVQGNAISQAGLDAIGGLRVLGKHCVYPLDRYPGAGRA